MNWLSGYVLELLIYWLWVQVLLRTQLNSFFDLILFLHGI